MRLWVSDDKNNYYMPLNEYRDTVVSLKSVLEQVEESLTVSHDLIRRLVALQALALDDPPLDYKCDNDDENDSGKDSSSALTMTTTTTTILDLPTALERARSSSQRWGRSALETEWAWMRVRQVVASLPKHNDDNNTLSSSSSSLSQQQLHSICPALLAHPSYRDSYGEFLLKRYKSSSIDNNSNDNNNNRGEGAGSPSKSTSTTRQLQNHAQTMQRTLRQLQSTVQDETIRLREIEQRRAIRVKKLNQSYWSSL